MKFSRTTTIHGKATWAWAPLGELEPRAVLANADGETLDAMGLSFEDEDGEVHIYVFTEAGRLALLEKLTGGIIVPGRNGLGL